MLLTTHSMEEADALGDRIGIMSAGQLVALGTSLHLKEKFGEGYRVKLVVPKDSREAIVRGMRSASELTSVEYCANWGGESGGGAQQAAHEGGGPSRSSWPL